jgi:hypothetical protein
MAWIQRHSRPITDLMEPSSRVHARLLAQHDHNRTRRHNFHVRHTAAIDAAAVRRVRGRGNGPEHIVTDYASGARDD